VSGGGVVVVVGHYVRLLVVVVNERLRGEDQTVAGEKKVGG
jgi:hypothetical protein